VADGRRFAKTVKSPYLSNRFTDIDEIWQDGADCPPRYKGQTVKISKFSKTMMVAAALLKNHKNRDITAKD